MTTVSSDSNLVVFSDDSIIVLNKPAELLSVPGLGADKQDCLASRVQAIFDDALIVHRLDMSTSGLIVMARGKDVHRQMSKQFRDRQVKKRYVAVVDGLIDKESGVIELPIITDWPNRPRQMMDHETGKASTTNYQVITRDEKNSTTRVELEPVTGRTHQLRVHMMSIGYPILGDRLYANEVIQAKSSRLLLHAVLLEFPHPVNGELMNFNSDIPF